MIRSRNYMALAALSMSVGLTVLTDEERDVLAKDHPTQPEKPLRWPYQSYVPQPPSAELISERLRLAAVKRARKAARLAIQHHYRGKK